jgi:hypothetical protein
MLLFLDLVLLGKLLWPWSGYLGAVCVLIAIGRRCRLR